MNQRRYYSIRRVWKPNVVMIKQHNLSEATDHFLTNLVFLTYREYSKQSKKKYLF